MTDDAFKRKVKTMAAYAGISLNGLAETVSMSINTLVNRLNIGMDEEMQQKVMRGLYYMAWPALEDDFLTKTDGKNVHLESTFLSQERRL